MRRRSPLPRLLMLLLVGAAIVIVLHQFRTHSLTPPTPATGLLTVSFFDNAQSDSTLIQTSSGKNILIDSGLTSAVQDLIGDVQVVGVHHLDLLIVTDSTQDHNLSVAAINRRIPTDSVMDNGFSSHNPAQIKLRQEVGLHTLARQWLPVGHLVGNRISLGDGTVIQYLSPLPHFTSARDIDNTIITRISLGKVGVLLTGAASQHEIGTLLSRGIDMRATVLKVASHGAAINTSPALLDRVNPKEVITSHDLMNSTLPKPTEPDILEKRRIEVWRTDRPGIIQLRTNGTTYRIIRAAE